MPTIGSSEELSEIGNKEPDVPFPDPGDQDWRDKVAPGLDLAWSPQAAKAWVVRSVPTRIIPRARVNLPDADFM